VVDGAAEGLYGGAGVAVEGGLAGEHEGLRVAVEGKRGGGVQGVRVDAAAGELFGDAGLEAWSFGAGEERELGFADGFGGLGENIERRVGLPGEELGGVVAVVEGKEAFAEVDGGLAFGVKGMNGDEGSAAVGFDPVDGVGVVTVTANDPGVAVVEANPGAGVADGPVVGEGGWVEFGAQDATPAGEGIDCDELAEVAGEAGEVADVFPGGVGGGGGDAGSGGC
jgi:hypothetical protein